MNSKYSTKGTSEKFVQIKSKHLVYRVIGETKCFYKLEGKYNLLPFRKSKHLCKVL